MNLTVADLMEPNPVFVFPETEISEAARLMREFDVAELLVTSDAHAVGIITRSDLVARLAAECRHPRLAGSIMTPNPRTVAPSDRLERAALLMIEHGVGRLPVCTELGLQGLLRWQHLAPFAGLDRPGCLIRCLRPGEVFSEPLQLPQALNDLDATLERVRLLRAQLRETERALRSWRKRVTRQTRQREPPSEATRPTQPTPQGTGPPRTGPATANGLAQAGAHLRSVPQPATPGPSRAGPP